jgi:hypothetical protein
MTTVNLEKKSGLALISLSALWKNRKLKIISLIDIKCTVKGNKNKII